MSDNRHLRLELERKTAAANGQPYAVPAVFPVMWEPGSPMPHVIGNGYRSYLVFLIQDENPDWDVRGNTLLSDPAYVPEPERYCIVTLEGCSSFKFGAPNEEVHSGHSLWGRGMEVDTAQIVVNSPWLEEVRAMNSVHRQYNPARWNSTKHYVFWFHDNTFECLATGVHAEVTVESSMSDLIGRIGKTLLR